LSEVCAYAEQFAYVGDDMRYVFWLLVLAGTAAAQWKHFGESAAAAPASSLAREMVVLHNAVRTRVGTRALKWSGDLASVAQQWADHLIESGQFAHSHNPKYGENLYEIEGGVATPADVVRAWAEEVRDYDYSSNSCRGVCGHYTQIVWGDTREVGCAVARAGRREVWACEYDPPGNWVGRKPY
jgi:pathogenesis-related protein 1